MPAENANAMLFLWSAPDLATISRAEHTLRTNGVFGVVALRCHDDERGDGRRSPKPVNLAMYGVGCRHIAGPDEVWRRELRQVAAGLPNLRGMLIASTVGPALSVG